jgi:hypothetical protein
MLVFDADDNVDINLTINEKEVDGVDLDFISNALFDLTESNKEVIPEGVVTDFQGSIDVEQTQSFKDLESIDFVFDSDLDIELVVDNKEVDGLSLEFDSSETHNFDLVVDQKEVSGETLVFDGSFDSELDATEQSIVVSSFNFDSDGFLDLAESDKNILDQDLEFDVVESFLQDLQTGELIVEGIGLDSIFTFAPNLSEASLERQGASFESEQAYDDELVHKDAEIAGESLDLFIGQGMDQNLVPDEKSLNEQGLSVEFSFFDDLIVAAKDAITLEIDQIVDVRFDLETVEREVERQSLALVGGDSFITQLEEDHRYIQSVVPEYRFDVSPSLIRSIKSRVPSVLDLEQEFDIDLDESFKEKEGVDLQSAIYKWPKIHSTNTKDVTDRLWTKDGSDLLWTQDKADKLNTLDISDHLWMKDMTDQLKLLDMSDRYQSVQFSDKYQ